MRFTGMSTLVKTRFTTAIIRLQISDVQISDVQIPDVQISIELHFYI